VGDDGARRERRLSSSNGSAGGSRAAQFVQDAEPPAREDCPERDGSGGNGEDGSGCGSSGDSGGTAETPSV
jgi:hypothetical protein